jgi:hypothetical protein
MTNVTNWTEIAQAWADVVSKAATIVAMVVAGFWTWLLYVRQRLRFPRAQVDIAVDHAELVTDKRLVHIAIRIVNVGTVVLKPQFAEARVRQVVPVVRAIAATFRAGCDPIPQGKEELEWPVIVSRKWSPACEIEPGESDTLHTDFVLESEVQLIQVYTFVGNPTKKQKDFGWSHTTFVSLAKNTLGGVTHVEQKDILPSSSDGPNSTEEKQQRRQQDQEQRQQQRQQEQQQEQQQQQQQRQEQDKGCSADKD